MANFKVNFVTSGKVINFTDCCCPNLINVVCRDMEMGQKYYVTFQDTPTYRAQIFPSKYSFIAESRVVGFKVINGGLGFTSTPTVEIVGGGASTVATATAVVSEKSFPNDTKVKTITDIILTNGGKGYTSMPTVNIVGGGGRGAIIKPILSTPVKNLTFFVAFGCNDKNMPIPTPYPSNTPTITPTATLTQTPTLTPTPTSIALEILPANVSTYSSALTENPIALDDYFADRSTYPVRVYLGVTGQSIVVPTGYDYAIYIKPDGSITDGAVIAGTSIKFKSQILLGKGI
jgi:hypothetical protein